MLVRRCALLLVIKDFEGIPNGWLAAARNASMQGVGTTVGTGGWGEPWSEPIH